MIPYGLAIQLHSSLLAQGAGKHGACLGLFVCVCVCVWLYLSSVVHVPAADYRTGRAILPIYFYKN